MYASQQTVEFAEQLLVVVKALAVNPSANGEANSLRPLTPLEAYQAQGKAEDLCTKVLQSVLGPSAYTLLIAESCQESAALGLASFLNIPDIIGDGEKSLDELVKVTGAEPHVLDISLACLLKHSIFKKGSSGGYQNTEYSYFLRKGTKDSIKELIEFTCDEGLKSGAFLYEATQQPTPVDGKKRLPASNVAYGFEEGIFVWMAKNSWRGERMGAAMKQAHAVANGNVVHEYPWSDLKPPIIDIGGGIGSLEMALLVTKEHANLDFVIFDIEKTIENGKKIWSGYPASMSSHVGFQAGDFFAPTLEESKIPPGMPTYIIRHVLLGRRDEVAIHILKAVRNAMLATTGDTKPKLLVCDMVRREDSPRFVYQMSMQLLSLNNGITRTEGNMVKLVEAAGYKVEKVVAMRAVDFIIEAIALP